MRITDLLKACSVELNGTPQTKEETIKQMVALMECSCTVKKQATENKR